MTAPLCINRRAAGLRRLAPLAPLVVLLALGGCKSAQEWREEADRVGEAYLSKAQKQVSGHTEPINIETPADTLRRRLLLDQDLMISDSASFGIRDLPANRYWRAESRLNPGEPGGAVEFAPEAGEILEISLLDAVRIAAHNSRDYQQAKEELFSAALALDLEDRTFRSTFEGLLSGAISSSRADGEDRHSSHNEDGGLSLSRTFENGAELTGALTFNIAGMLDGDRSTAWGSVADLSISIPLLRGAGRLVKMESLTQAQRDLIYAVRSFEQTKRAFVVEIAGSYLNLLLALRTRQNEDENYKRVILSTRRSRRMADASRMSLSEFDQSHQSELSARASWIAACQSYEASLESFKMRLGLPPDARIQPRTADLNDLQAYAETYAGTKLGPYDIGDGSQTVTLEAPESVDAGDMKERTDRAIRLAFTNRLDFVSYRDRIEDAQRHLLIAEDALRAEFTIGGTASVGEAASPSMGAQGKDHADFKIKNATYGGTVHIDLPIERSAERNSYRNALISLERAVRTYQEQEDQLKRTIRQAMRDLSQELENLRIQHMAVDLAQRRVRNQDLLLQAGRAEMTDVLDAQAALVRAQNSLYSAVTSYRESELSLQSALGILDVGVDGVWTEADLSALRLRKAPDAGEPAPETETAPAPAVAPAPATTAAAVLAEGTTLAGLSARP